MVTRSSLCVAATPCLERSKGHKEEVRVFLFCSLLKQATLFFTVQIRLLDVYVYIPSIEDYYDHCTCN